MPVPDPDGTHATVLKRMRTALAKELPALTTRGPDDPALALLDAFATVADVVTFYHERIHAEGYLRSATEQRSVLELARAIGYELRPGVAAAAWLAFDVEAVPGAPEKAEVAERTGVRSVPGQDQTPQTFETTAPLTARAARNAIELAPVAAPAESKELHLDGVATGLRPGDGLLVTTDDKPRDFRIVRSMETTTSTTRVTLDAAVNATATLWVPRLRANVFGHNAADWRALPDTIRKNYLDPPTGPTWPDFALPEKADKRALDLDGEHPLPAVGSVVVLTQPGVAEPAFVTVAGATTAGRAGFGLSGRVTRLTLKEDLPATFDRRLVTVHARPEELQPAGARPPDLIAGAVLTLRALPPESDLVTGAPVLVTAQTEAGDPFVGRGRVSGPTEVTLANAPPALRPASVRVHANVVAATHGETVEDEVLGSGDAAATHQRFALAHPELTYVTAPGGDGGGIASSLEVRVDGVRWGEVASLYLAGPTDRVYVVRIDDEARATVVFGDGVRGARLPTDVENVRARYRHGIGPDGDAAAGALSLLARRPLGIAGVTNPEDAVGGVGPERLAEARANAPRAVLTLGRVVSLRDHEDVARTFAGVALARATALRVGGRAHVHVTVAGPKGTPVDDDRIAVLHREIADLGGDAEVLRIQTATPTKFSVGLAVLTEPAYVRVEVEAALTDALRAAFAAERRAFAQPVNTSEVIDVAAAVPGVVALRVTELARPRATATLSDKPSDKPSDELSAADARWSTPDVFLPAELLVLGVVTVTEMTP